MDEVKINKRGQVTIPKEMREALGLSEGISLKITMDGRSITLKPAIVCHHCKKTLPDAFRNKNACPDCPPTTIIKVY